MNYIRQTSNGVKKTFLTVLLVGSLFPLIILAFTNSYTVTDVNSGLSYTATYEGFVPCGRTPSVIMGIAVNIDCSLCHLFVMIDGIVDFVLLKLVPPIATLILIFAGMSFYFALGNPEKFRHAKSVLLSVIIGLIIIYASWIIINAVMVEIMGMADWVGFGEGWFRIDCPIETGITW